MPHGSSSRVLPALMALISVLVATVFPQLVAGQGADDGESFPSIELDVLADFRWSDRSLVATPGQHLTVTNRDVERHTFAVDEWGIDVNLPSLTPVDVVVPDDAEIGVAVAFYSSVGSDREDGLEGIIQIVSEEEILGGAGRDIPASSTVEDRVSIEMRDDFTFTPSMLNVAPGAFLEIRNTGVIEHHFVLDEWNVNQTIPAGDIAIVQVPEEVEPGETFSFYCSVPGHQAQGMTGTLTVVAARASVQTIAPDESGRVSIGKDLRPFVPGAEFLGSEWSRLRTGDPTTLLALDQAVSGDIFPFDGLGAVYVGPQGSRVTLIVLPLTERAVPANQVKDAITSVQESMMASWNKDRIGSAAYTDAAPPTGCDVAQRASGIVPLVTIPAGATACQLRSAGVAIFVTVEGAVGDDTGVAASDEVITLLLTRQSPTVALAGAVLHSG